VEVAIWSAHNPTECHSRLARSFAGHLGNHVPVLNFRRNVYGRIEGALITATIVGPGGSSDPWRHTSAPVFRGELRAVDGGTALDGEIGDRDYTLAMKRIADLVTVPVAVLFAWALLVALVNPSVPSGWGVVLALGVFLAVLRGTLLILDRLRDTAGRELVGWLAATLEARSVDVRERPSPGILSRLRRV